MYRELSRYWTMVFLLNYTKGNTSFDCHSTCWSSICQLPLDWLSTVFNWHLTDILTDTMSDRQPRCWLIHDNTLWFLLSATADMCIEHVSWKVYSRVVQVMPTVNLWILNSWITNMCIANRLPMLSLPTVIDWHSTNTRLTVKCHSADNYVNRLLTNTNNRCSDQYVGRQLTEMLVDTRYNLKETWSIDSFSEKFAFVWTLIQHIIYIYIYIYIYISHSFLSI